MENEENRGLVNRNASEDQLESFWQVLVELSFYSLSLILLDMHSLLEHSWRSVEYMEFGVKRKSNKRKVQEDIGINSYNEFFL